MAEENLPDPESIRNLNETVKNLTDSMQDLRDAAEQQSKENARINKAFYETLKAGGKSAELSSRELDKLRDTIYDVDSMFEKFGGKSIKNVERQFAALQKEVKKGGGDFKDVGRDLKNLQEMIDDSSEIQANSNKKRELQDRLNFMAERARNENLADMSKKIGGTIISGFTTYYLNQIKTGLQGVMGGGSPFQVAADLQIAAYTDIAGTVKGIGGAAQAAGGALAMIPNPATMAAGALISLTGSLLSFGAEKAAEALKLKTELTSKALETAYNSFLKASNAGIVLGGGMTEMRNHAFRAGLTTEQFSNVLEKSAPRLAEAGYTVSGGAKIMANVTKQLATETGKSGKSLQKELLNLGFSVEDQASLTADVMADMKRTGAGKASAQVIAQTTAEYAKNLKLISDITGEDARARMEATKKANEEYAFKAKVLEFAKTLPKEERALYQQNVAAGMAVLDEQTQAAIRQKVIVGAVTDSAVYLTGTIDAIDEVSDNLFKVGMTADQIAAPMTKKYGEFAKGMDENLMAFNAATSVTGNHAEVTKYATSLLAYGAKVNEENVKTSKEAIDAAAGTADPLTQGVNESVVAMQKMRQSIEKDMTYAITHFAEQVPEILKGFRKKLEELGLLGKVTGVSAAMGMREPERQRPVAGGYSADYFKKAPGESDASYKQRMEDYAKDVNAKAAAVPGKRPAYRPPGAGRGPAAQSGVAPVPSAGGLEGLKLRPYGDVHEEGSPISSKLLNLLHEIQSKIPGFAYFSGINDQYHKEKSPSSKHTQGLAADFTLQPQPTKEQGAQIVNQLKGMGASIVIDEYNDPSANATGGHIHVEVPKLATGGIVEGPRSGYPAILHGKEAVLPLTTTIQQAAEMFAKNGSTMPQVAAPTSANGDMEKVGIGLQQQTFLLQQILSTMQRSNSIQSGILEANY